MVVTTIVKGQVTGGEMLSVYDGHGGSEVRLSSLENLDPQKKLTLTPWEPGKRRSRMAPQFGGVCVLCGQTFLRAPWQCSTITFSGR